MKFIRISSTSDSDLAFINEVLRHPSVSRFVSIDNDNFWQYVTQNENVYCYKIFNDNVLIATVHCELDDKVLYLAIVVFPKYQRMGFGGKIIKYIQGGNIDIEFDKISAFIEQENIPSLTLFRKMGFECKGKDEELYYYEYTK